MASSSTSTATNGESNPNKKPKIDTNDNIDNNGVVVAEGISTSAGPTNEVLPPQPISSSSSPRRKKPRTYISRLVVQFQKSLFQLNAKNVTDSKLEKMSILIHECMSISSRNYHSVQHVFDIISGSSGFSSSSKDTSNKSLSETSPIASLAALFHDCIYCHVDGGLSDVQRDVLDGCLDDTVMNTTTTQNNNHNHSNHSNTTNKFICIGGHSILDTNADLLLCMVESIFGYNKEGIEITTKNGLNEFLSAMVAVRQLKDHLTTCQLAQITVCIAATIPFQNGPSSTQNGNPTYMETLYNNMIQTQQQFATTTLKLEPDTTTTTNNNNWIIQSIQLAAQLANEDVSNFGTEDRLWFLDNTWSLLPETNISLRREYLYTILEYHEAVYKMSQFFNYLQPNVIFATFRGIPTPQHINYLTEQATQNLNLGTKYIGAKLLSASVLAAVAVLTGGDSPISLFMGDLPSRQHEDSQHLGDYLPIPNNINNNNNQNNNNEMFDILVNGRRSESSFDIKASPLAAYLYCSLGGEDGIMKLLTKEKKELLMSYPMTKERARQLLHILPNDAVHDIGCSMAEVAVSRKTAIQTLLKQYTI